MTEHNVFYEECGSVCNFGLEKPLSTWDLMGSSVGALMMIRVLRATQTIEA